MNDNHSNLNSLNDLFDIADALGLNSYALTIWLQAMAKPSGHALALYCSQLPPAVWAGADDPSSDALGWASQNPNGFGYQRALDALRHWGAAWPGGDAPLSAQRFYHELILGQACALFFGINPLPIGMAPAISDGGVYVLRYASSNGCTSWSAYDRDAHAFHAAWDYDAHGPGPLRAQTTWLPSLAGAQLALDIMLGGDGQGAGWVAGASR
jgi:hypothetical protein